MRCRALVLAGVVGLLIVLGAAAAPTRRPITQADSGKTFRIARDATATFRLSNRWLWSTPRSSTKAIELSPVDYFIDPGFQEWQIDARARGSAILRAYGRPNCDGCALGPRRVRITFVVGANWRTPRNQVVTLLPAQDWLSQGGGHELPQVLAASATA